MKSLFVALFLAGASISLGAQIVDTTVCDVLANPMSFDGKLVRVKGMVIAGLDEFVVKDASCKHPVSAIWLAYPEGSKAKAGAAAVVQIQIARNNAATVSAPIRTEVKLDKNKDFKQFDSRLSTPGWPGALCLGCVRYTVTATLVGRLDGSKSAGVVRDKSGKAIGVEGFGNLNRYSARLVLQSVADVAPQEIAYAKPAASTSAVGFENDAPAGDPVAIAHRSAKGFGAGSAAGDRIERAAAAFGKPGESNGVEVSFGAPNEVPKGDGAKGEQDSPDGLLFNCKFNMDRLPGNALAAAIVHLGSHVADVRDPQVSPDMSLYALERPAWQTTVLSAVALGQKTMTLPGGYVAWSETWPAAERGNMADQSIVKFLSEWSSLMDAK